MITYQHGTSAHVIHCESRFDRPVMVTFEHHGVKGQKWGIRRYQDYDGKYTQAGLKKYKAAENKYQNAKTISSRKAAKKAMKAAYKSLKKDYRADKGKEYVDKANAKYAKKTGLKEYKGQKDRLAIAKRSLTKDRVKSLAAAGTSLLLNARATQNLAGGFANAIGHAVTKSPKEARKATVKGTLFAAETVAAAAAVGYGAVKAIGWQRNRANVAEYEKHLNSKK